MSFLRRLMGSFGRGMVDHHRVQVGDRYVKTDGKYQSVWTVHQIVNFDGVPPHARIMPNQDVHLGYRTISVVALMDSDFYRHVPRADRTRQGDPSAS